MFVAYKIYGLLFFVSAIVPLHGIQRWFATKSGEEGFKKNLTGNSGNVCIGVAVLLMPNTIRIRIYPKKQKLS